MSNFLAGVIIKVNTVADNDTQGDQFLTLREAIELANGTLGLNALSVAEKALITGVPAAGQADTINFMIPGAGPYVIALTTALPPITDTVTIDGNTQPGFMANPIIQLSGANIQGNANGLDLQTSNSLIRGLVVRNFSDDGIAITGNTNQIQNCFIGTNVTGTQAAANGVDGVFILNGTDNVIGGAAGNLISGNSNQGINISGTASQRNVVKGNKIGTDVNGEAALPNGDGVLIYNGARNNTIGGVLGSTDENLIAGNTNNGVYINGTQTLGNVVSGNYIGTDLSGAQALGNGQNGVLIDDGASSNWIGLSSTNGTYNIISGNTLDGVHIEGTASTLNKVRGNIIGLDRCGVWTIVANGLDGVNIVNAPSNTVGGRASQGEGNVISGNAFAGVHVGGSDSVSNYILGNLIGTAVDGITPRGNTRQGVSISSTRQTVVGGTTPADDRNVISGNGEQGIYIDNASQTTVQGNYIGVDAAGNGGPPNFAGGITVERSTDTTIGGTTEGARNVIAGNLGTNGPTFGNGIALLLGTTRTVIQGNYIGLTASGQADGNAGDGVYVDGTSSNNTIGGSDASARNYISANGTGTTRGYGIDLVGTNNTVDFNYVGLDLNGNATPGFANVLGWLFDRGGNTIGQNNQHN